MPNPWGVDPQSLVPPPVGPRDPVLEGRRVGEGPVPGMVPHGMIQVYERVPYVLFSALTTTATQAQFAEQDLRNDAGFDLEIEAMGINLAAAQAGTASQALDDISLRITDVYRNQPWMRNFTPAANLVDVAVGSAPNAAGVFAFQGSKWHLRHKTVLPPLGNLRAELQNNIAPTSITANLSFLGSILVPVVPGTQFAEAVRHSLYALPT